MTIVKANLDSIENMHAQFKDENNKILNNIKLLKDELGSIDSIVSTPKSNDVIPKFIDCLNQNSDFITQKNETFDGYFEKIKKEYNDYINDVKEKVGGI